jgi:tRNA(Ile)-lysidine synthase TilS/MesJ
MRTEVDWLEKRIRERFVKAFVTYQLIENDDHILVALSGGKDSLCLLEMLGKRVRINQPKFRVEAIHVRMENVAYETSTDYLEQFCSDLDVPLHIVTTSFSTTSASHNSQFSTPNSQSKEKPPCFLCSWNRRKQIFNLAQELECNKIALGHHQDDLLHTCLMNQFYQGRFDTMPAMLRMRKMPLSIIRPLCLVQETDIQRYAELRGYVKQVKLCPYEHDTHRADMKVLFEHIQQQNPEARHSLWNAIERSGKLVQMS